MELSFSHCGVALRFHSRLSVWDATSSEKVLDLDPGQRGPAADAEPIPALGSGRLSHLSVTDPQSA